MTQTPGLSDNTLHVLDLLLAAREGTEPLLGKLPGPLILSVSQQFNNAALIGSKTDDLAGDFADESGTARGLALGAADPGLGRVKGGRFLL